MTTTGANIGLVRGYAAHDDGWGLGSYNPGFAAIDTLMFLAVIARQAAPPGGTPTDGDRYLVVATATGAFAGNEGKIAAYLDGGWVFYSPHSGWQCFDIATHTLLTYSSGAWLGAKYIIGAAVVSGVLTANQVLFYHRFAKAVTIPANFGTLGGYASRAGGSANATGSTAIDVQKAATGSPLTFSSIGTITIAASSIAPTFTTAGSAVISFAASDIIRGVAPADADATFADFYATLVAFET